MKYAFVIILSLVLTNCATKSPEEIFKNKLKNIGAVSTLDNSMPILFYANPKKVFREVRLDTTHWDLNQIVTQEIQNSLKAIGKSSSIISLDQKIVDEQKDEAMQLKNIYLGNRYQAVQQYILDESKKQNMSFVISLHPAASVENTNYKAGYGLLCENTTRNKKLIAYFSIATEIWNTETQDAEAKTALSHKDLSVETDFTCDQALKMKPADLGTALRATFEDLSRKAAHLSLRNMGLK